MLNSVRTMAFLAMAFLSANSSAQSQHLYEVGPTTETIRTDSATPTQYQSHGSYLFFIASSLAGQDNVHARTLWRLDTRDNSIAAVVDDIHIGTSNYVSYQILNDKIIYFTWDGLIFKSITGQDKTLIPDLRNNSGTSRPNKMATFNGEVYFSASRTRSGSHSLWRTDGTVAGTKEVPLCVADQCYQNPEQMVISGNKLFLIAHSTDRQPVVWSVDGQNNATLFNEVIPTLSGPQDKLTPYQNGVHFNSKNGFWYTDGTKAGSYQIKLDINKPDWPGKEAISLGSTMIVASDELYSVANYGKGTSTQIRLDPLVPNNIDQPGLPHQLTVFKNKVYFMASFYNLYQGNRTPKLLSYDGSGTAKEVYTFETVDTHGFKMLGVKGQKFLFLRYEKRSFEPRNPTINELWVSDGTKAGTVKISDHGPAYHEFMPSDWTFLNNDFYFTGFSTSHGFELWRSDGSAEGTQLAKDLGYSKPRTNYGHMHSDDKDLYYQIEHAWRNESGDQQQAFELWRTDVATMRSAKVNAWPELNNPGDGKIVPVENGHYWWIQSKTDPFGKDLMFYNKHTEAVTTVRTGTGECVYFIYLDRVLLTKGDQYFFYAPVREGETSSCQLWVSDGTAAGTKAITNFPKIVDSWTDAISNVVTWNGEFYFSLNGVSEEYLDRKTAVYKTDGTAGNTTEAFRLSDAGAPIRSGIGSMTATSGGIFMLSGFDDVTLWYWSATGLTKLGTWPGGYKQPRHLVRFGEGITFVQGNAIYSSDGTVQGTKPLLTLHPSASEPNEYPELASTPDFKHLVFSAKDDSNKVRIWLSDGTSAGTRALAGPATEYDFTFHALVGDDLYISTFSRSSVEQNTEYMMRYSLTGSGAEVIHSEAIGSQYKPFKVVQAQGRVFIANDFSAISLNRIYATARLDNGDLDKDGVLNNADALPLHSDEQIDTDADGIGNNIDLDDDGDEEPDSTDLFPLNGAEWADHDGDGIGDIADTDDDNDKAPDWDDAYPRDASRYTNTVTIPVHLPVPPTDTSSGSGGTMHFMAWFAMLLLVLQRRRVLQPLL